MKKIFCLVSFLLVGCATTPPVGGMTDREYAKLAKENTQKTSQYKGFYQTFQADVTFLTSALRSAGVARQAAFQQWDADHQQKERDRIFQEMASQTDFFLRFYTPESDNDDLSAGSSSMWHLYLDIGGKRYEGTVKKLNGKMAELMTLYPNHDRFSTPYQVSFKIPTAAVEAASSKFTITSSLGTAEFEFGGAKK